jgi:predicted RNA-binding Zn-ribbon protein involved in translation (DUF1610 family)
VLLSELLSFFAGHLTEETVSFACDRCGRTVVARDAALSAKGDDLVYRCPDDGRELALVRGEDLHSAKWAGYVDIAVQRGGVWTPWAEVVDRGDLPASN